MASTERTQRSAKPIKLVGRYALFDRIASGGMASVHLGRLVGAAGFARTVAIKRLRSNFARDPKFVEMFSDEARLAARIRHPNVAVTIDCVSDGGELLLVLEYVHGQSLSKLIAQTADSGGIDPRIAVAVAIGALHGLQAAHDARSERGEPLGIIHRDVSPQNILIGDDGVPRVVDFGIAKAAGRLQRTESGHVKGKPRYMAPEQLQGELIPIDHRVDVFSMGAVVWEALIGRPLFDHKTFMGVLAQVLRKPIPPPHEIAAGIDPALSLAVLRALERNPRERYSSAREFALALEDACPRGVASQHAISTWLRERASAVLAERQALLEEIETLELSLGDRPSAIAPVSFEEQEEPPPSAPLEEEWPEDLSAEDRQSVETVLANLKTIRLPPRSPPVAPRVEPPAAGRRALQESIPDETTVDNKFSVHVRSTDLLASEPREGSASSRPPMPRIEVPAKASILDAPSSAPPPPPAASVAPPRAGGRVLWLIVGVIFVVAAVLAAVFSGALRPEHLGFPNQAP